MATAYAGLVSLSHILNQILNPPPNHHFDFARERVESLLDVVSFLIDFLEIYHSRSGQEIEQLETRIVAATYEAEEIIESDVVAQIQTQHANLKEKITTFTQNEIDSEELHEGTLSKVVESFVSIKKDLLEIKRRKGSGKDEISTRSSSASSTSLLPRGKNDKMVGFEEHMKQIRYDLAADYSKLLIVPIVGMGGIGKTTLARNAYADPYITESFDVRAWVSISQEFKERETLITLLQQINSNIEGHELSINEVGVLLHKELYGKRYLIVLDDMWNIQAWDRLRKFLPDTGDGSRILVTTRLVKLANDLGSPSPHQMTLLDDENSWNLVYEYVKEDCPMELMEIGKEIAKGCGGLPLALVVIGGLLAKSEKSKDFWEYVKENVSSTANYAGDEKCIEILRLSYIQLPLHLKPCFLYLTMFPKTFEIRVSRLVRLWVAEGFIKPREGKSLEEVAESYLKDLYDRNLIMIGKRGHSGKVKKYNIHDVIRDLCMSEAHKNKFLCIANLDDPNSSQQLQGERRLSIYTGKEALNLGTHSRSLLCYYAWESRRHVARRLKLLRVLDVMDSYSVDEIMWLTNSRYITCAIPREFHVASFVSLLWNIQTLVFPGPISLPYEFWQMPQLRHVKSHGITLTSPLQDDENLVVLENLQTLKTVRDFIYSENVIRRIPNLTKLGIDCDATEGVESFCLSNLASPLKRLDSLVLRCRGTWRKMVFPNSLKKLTLSNCQIPWEDMSVVGSLPNLEELKLRKRAAKGRKWSPNEGEFLQLKFLLIDWCQLEIWEADDTHFPSLEHLQLVGVRMQKFPAAFAEIAALLTIDLHYCSEALLSSAKQMSGEREDFGFEGIQIRSFPPQASRSRKRELVGMEDEAEILKGHLFEECQELDVISIVGLGGLGKTTMARMLFDDPEIQYEFPIRVWITVSHSFSEKKAFISILREFTTLSDDIRHKSSMELAELVSYYLGSAKFLVIMDDVWRQDDFNKLGNALPMNNKNGKILITSRIMAVCEYASRREPHRLHPLTCEESWLLFQLEVFGKPKFPSELEVEGRKIADKCKGLPLAVVLIGGAVVRKLSASAGMGAMTKALEEVSATLGARFRDEISLPEIFMPLAYAILPYPLRKCFLYVGMFPEDYEIPTWQLLRMWIAEGFID